MAFLSSFLIIYRYRGALSLFTVMHPLKSVRERGVPVDLFDRYGYISARENGYDDSPGLIHHAGSGA